MAVVVAERKGCSYSGWIQVAEVLECRLKGAHRNLECRFIDMVERLMSARDNMEICIV